MLGTVHMGMRVLVVSMGRVLRVTMLVLVVLRARYTLVMTFTVRMNTRVLTIGMSRVLGVTVLVLGVLRRGLDHDGGSFTHC